MQRGFTVRAPRNKVPTCTALGSPLGWSLTVTQGAPCCPNPPGFSTFRSELKHAVPQPRYLDFKTLTAGHSNLIECSRFEDIVIIIQLSAPESTSLLAGQCPVDMTRFTKAGD